MAYNARVLEVMIASPGDVDAERAVVREVLAEWNTLHSRHEEIVFQPRGWDTDSAPELGAPPQQIINRQVLQYADILIGIFWTRLGTPTAGALSGTVEEVSEHHRAGKPVLLFFSEKPVPRSSDRSQLQGVDDFKAWAAKEGLYAPFADEHHFRDELRKKLQIVLRTNSYLNSLLETDFVRVFEDALRNNPPLSDDARALLSKAAVDPQGVIMAVRHLKGTSIRAGGQHFGDEGSHRDVARWLGAIEELEKQNMIEATNQKREVFRVRNEGYLAAEGLFK